MSSLLLLAVERPPAQGDRDRMKNLPGKTAFVTGGASGIGPVSYTHLDVYKRQAAARLIDGRSGWGATLASALSNVTPTTVGLSLIHI